MGSCWISTACFLLTKQPQGRGKLEQQELCAGFLTEISRRPFALLEGKPSRGKKAEFRWAKFTVSPETNLGT
jgi:hypothetical protein